MQFLSAVQQLIYPSISQFAGGGGVNRCPVILQFMTFKGLRDMGPWVCEGGSKSAVFTCGTDMQVNAPQIYGAIDPWFFLRDIEVLAD